jgi:large conductance mechanosensitive channel
VPKPRSSSCTCANAWEPPGGFSADNRAGATNPLSSKVTADSLVEAKKQGVVLAWGNFITVAINFVIIAAALFIVVKGINHLKKQQAEEPAKPLEPTREEVLLTEIRDALKAKM